METERRRLGKSLMAHPGLMITGGVLLAVQVTAVAFGTMLEGFLLSFPVYLVACREVLRRPADRDVVPLVLLVSVGLRAITLFSWPSLSDDVYRYIWDGRLVVSGINPYLYTPESVELEGLRDGIWAAVSSKGLHTPYPPLMEATFAGVYLLAPDSVKAMQMVASALDLAVVAMVLVVLLALDLPAGRVLVYAWSPLPVLQFAHSGHLDALLLLPLLAAIYLLAPGRLALSGAALALSALAKMVSLALGPIFLWAWGLRGALAFGLMLALGYLPFVGAGTMLFVTLLVEERDAVFNDSLALLLRRIMGPEAAHLVAVLAVAGLAALFLARPAVDVRSVAWRCYILLGLGLLLSPVVQPWYLTWLLPFLCLYLRPSSSPLGIAATPSLAWLCLSGLVVLTELTYPARNGPSIWPVVRLVEYGTFYGVLAVWAAGRVLRHVWHR